MPEKVKIKIVSFSRPHLWYAKFVGEQFTAIKLSYSWQIVLDNDSRFPDKNLDYWVMLEDAEVV